MPIRFGFNTITFLSVSLSLVAQSHLAFASEASVYSVQNFINAANRGTRSPLITDIDTMESLRLNIAQLSTPPWSGWDWFKTLGGIAAPYGHPDFPNSRSSMNLNLDFIHRHLDSTIANSAHLSQVEIDRLSPAEKYDLLIGDARFELTQNFTRRFSGLRQAQKTQEWEGICEGWAAASIKYPRPQHAVDLHSKSGQRIRFFPDDIKALLSHNESANQVRDRDGTWSIGSLCRKEDQRTNPTNGRATTRACFDVNPADLHLALTNGIGVAHESFIMDTDGGSRAFFKAVRGYSYHFFNPLQPEINVPLATAKLGVAAYLSDPFRSHRSRDAHSIVGVHLFLHHTRGNPPTQSLQDDPAHDAGEVMQLDYDLELNATNEIVGGEWRMSANNPFGHPDLIWKRFPRNVNAESRVGPPSTVDSTRLPPWNGIGPLPVSWGELMGRLLEDPFRPATLYQPLLDLMVRRAHHPSHL